MLLQFLFVRSYIKNMQKYSSFSVFFSPSDKWIYALDTSSPALLYDLSTYTYILEQKSEY
jgi:hypothetical protein